MIVGILRLKDDLSAGQALACFHIVVHLVVQTALQLGAHACQFLRIQRDVLETGGIGAHAREVLHPGGAAELSSARTSTADTSSLLTCPDLLHLDAHMEGSCQVFDELTEVHALVSDIVEDGLVAITLILHIANLHVESKSLSYLATLNHR